MFAAPLAPHLAARAEGRRVDPQLLRTGLEFWRESCDIVLVEGAGGLMSPVSDDDYNADLADEFGYPLIIVAANVLGTINATLQTLIVADTFRDGLDDRRHRAQFAAAHSRRSEHRQQRRRTGPALRPAAVGEVDARRRIRRAMSIGGSLATGWIARSLHADADFFRVRRRRLSAAAVPMDEANLHAPAAFGVGFDEPVRLHDDRLMHQLEAGFRLAHRFDREGPEAARPVDLEVDVEAEPVVGEAERVDVDQVEHRAELAERLCRRRRGSSGRRRPDGMPAKLNSTPKWSVSPGVRPSSR